MQNKIRETRQNVIILVMNIAIVVFGIIMVICGFVATSNLLDRFSVPNDERSMYYRLNDGDFGQMVNMYHQNVQAGFGDDRQLQEYYGVAEYYEAASFYKVFLDAGDTARAEREKVKMDAALEKMGGWSIVEQEINKLLGIE